MAVYKVLENNKFLSTPSARRATRVPYHWGQPVFDFYPRPLRGGRRSSSTDMMRPHRISIHALCEEGDASCWRTAWA